MFTVVPDTLAALIAVANSALPGVTVIDGAPDVDNLLDEFLSVGWSRDEDDESVSGVSVDQGNHTNGEQFLVRHVLSVATGDTGLAAVADRRARAATLLAAYGSALRADPALGGLLQGGGRADLTNFSWFYGSTEQGGTFAEIAFDVDVSVSYLGSW